MDASTEHLYDRLGLLKARLRAAVVARRRDDPEPDDRFRGLYVSDAQADRLLGSSPPFTAVRLQPQEAAALHGIEQAAEAAELAGEDVRLRRLARVFGLDAPDVELLLVALAPDLDPRMERLYGYLNDDVSRRRATIGLALELTGLSQASGSGRRRLTPAGTLLSAGLLLVEEVDRPFLTRSLRVPDRVIAHLLGEDDPDPLLADLLVRVDPVDGLDVTLLRRGLGSDARLCYLRERPGSVGAAAAVSAAAAILPVLVLDLLRVRTDEDISLLAATAERDARLGGAALIVAPLEVLAERGPAAVRAFAEMRCPVVLVGSCGWDPLWSRRAPLLLDAAAPTPVQQQRIWQVALDGAGCVAGLAHALSSFRLTPEQTQRAAESARLRAAAEARQVHVGDLQAGARAQNSAGLERLARRVQPRVSWDDLVLPAEPLAQLRELAARARHRDRVLDGWRMGLAASRGRGVTALFAGDSGTGKTMSAEIVAGELGLDLYVVDLATVVDKYIGETEKNLDRIFVEADGVNGVLLFDEADALFGKRSEVSDARDRYANVEVAYLLQRMERFDGVAVLTTNLRSNLDEAFTRRLDAIVDFPAPEEEDRRRLWEAHLRPELPRGDDLDLDFLARAFRLTGGEIRNIAVTAAYLAVAENRPVGMADLIRATKREYHKLGRLCLEAEFGQYYGVIMEESAHDDGQ